MLISLGKVRINTMASLLWKKQKDRETPTKVKAIITYTETLQKEKDQNIA